MIPPRGPSIVSALPTPQPQPDGDNRPMEVAEPSPEDIAADAYARYVARGYKDGHDVEDWLAAENALRRVADRSGAGAGYDQEKVLTWTET